MVTTLKHRIIELLSRDPGELYSISDIAKRLGVAYSHAHGFVKTLVSEDVLLIKKIGNVSVCSLNLTAPMTLSLLSIIESRRALEWMKKNPQSAKLMERVEIVKDNVHCVLVKGNRVVLVVPEKIKGAEFSIFKNRVVLNHRQLRRKRKQYNDRIVLHGAEKYWSLMSD